MRSMILLSYDQAVESESQELELDLSSLGAVNTMFAALFRQVYNEFMRC
jgi:hypothetical protein